MSWRPWGSDKKPRPSPLAPLGTIPNVPISRRAVEQAWEDWLQLPEGPRSVPSSRLGERWTPLPPGWAFTQQGVPVRVCLSVGQAKGQGQYLVGLCMLSTHGSWVSGRQRIGSSWGPIYQALEEGTELGARHQLPFDPSLRHGMPDRPPDEAWVGITAGFSGHWVKIYRRWADRSRLFVEPMSIRIPTAREAVQIAHRVAAERGLPLRVPKGTIDPGRSLLYGRASL